MLAHALVLPLLLADLAHGPEVHVLPPLELRGPGVTLAQAEAEVVAAAPAPQAALARPRSGTARAYGGALLGGLVSDAVFVGAFALAIVKIDEGFFADEGVAAGWALLGLTAAAGFATVTPAAMVWGAQHASGSDRRTLPAYGAAFAIRAAGFFAAAAFPPVLFLTELVLAPYVAALIVSGGQPIGAGPRAAPPEPPGPPAVPEASPSLGAARCPDTALAWR